MGPNLKQTLEAQAERMGRMQDYSQNICEYSQGCIEGNKGSGIFRFEDETEIGDISGGNSAFCGKQVVI